LAFITGSNCNKNEYVVKRSKGRGQVKFRQVEKRFNKKNNYI
jgi:hypothetical protein